MKRGRRDREEEASCNINVKRREMERRGRRGRKGSCIAYDGGREEGKEQRDFAPQMKRKRVDEEF
jgi:hypothetical protein